MSAAEFEIPPSDLYWTDQPEKGWSYALDLINQHFHRLNEDRATMAMYYNRVATDGIAIDDDGQISQLDIYDLMGASGNSLTREVVDAGMAAISRTLSTTVVPVGGDGRLKRSCEVASRIVDGIMNDQNFVRQVSQRAISDGMKCSSFGAVETYYDEDLTRGKVVIERVHPMDLFWDLEDGDHPLTMIRRYSIPRRNLLKKFPGHADLIHKQTPYFDERIPSVDTQRMRSVGYSGHRIQMFKLTALAHGDSPGRQVLVLDGGLLQDKEWKWNRHPYSIFRWDWENRGFGGTSLASIISSHDRLARRITAEILDALRGCVPIIWAHRQDKFTGISDKAYRIGRYDGNAPPVVTTAGTIPNELIASEQRNRTAAFALGGVNFASSTGQIPPGLKSEPAINSWNETVDARHGQQLLRVEDWWRDVAEAVIMAAREAKGHKFTTMSGSILEEAELPDLREGSYVVQVTPASGLPRTLAGKISSISSLTALGAIKPKDSARFIGIPDVARARDESFAAEELADKIVSDALIEGVWPEFGLPEDPETLSVLMVVMRTQYNIALRVGKYKEDNIAIVARLMRAAADKMTALVPPPPPPPGPIAGPPGMDPGLEGPAGVPLQPVAGPLGTPDQGPALV